MSFHPVTHLKVMTVQQLSNLLAYLEPDMLLHPNDVGNLLIIKPDESSDISYTIGIIDFALDSIEMWDEGDEEE